MARIPDDDNYDEFMNASAEEWSKPEEPPPLPQKKPERVNRWGSPIPEEGTDSDPKRWGSEPIEPSRPKNVPQDQKKKSGAKWWIIAIVILVVLCLCLCITIFALSAMGIGPLAGMWLFDFFQ